MPERQVRPRDVWPGVSIQSAQHKTQRVQAKNIEVDLLSPKDGIFTPSLMECLGYRLDTCLRMASNNLAIREEGIVNSSVAVWL